MADNPAIEYVIELAPPILPGSTPQPLANGIAIDMDGSKFPGGWYSDNGPTGLSPEDRYITHMDILFSPRGEVIGSAAAAGVMHFVIADVEDIEFEGARLPNAGNVIPSPQKPERLVTLFARTGLVTTGQVNRPLNPSGPSVNPYEYGLAGKDVTQ
jgi:hypothetical protein